MRLNLPYYSTPTHLDHFPWILIDNNLQISYNKLKCFVSIKDISYQYIPIMPWFGQTIEDPNLEEIIENYFNHLLRKEFL